MEERMDFQSPRPSMTETMTKKPTKPPRFGILRRSPKATIPLVEMVTTEPVPEPVAKERTIRLSPTLSTMSLW